MKQKKVNSNNTYKGYASTYNVETLRFLILDYILKILNP